MVVENRPGGSARNGLNAMKTAQKDGYLLACGSRAELDALVQKARIKFN